MRRVRVLPAVAAKDVTAAARRQRRTLTRQLHANPTVDLSCEPLSGLLQAAHLHVLLLQLLHARRQAALKIHNPGTELHGDLLNLLDLKIHAGSLHLAAAAEDEPPVVGHLLFSITLEEPRDGQPPASSTQYEIQNI